MSAAVELRTYYGVEAPRETFWTQTGETRACGRDLSHAVLEDARFCHVCGAETKTISIETPSLRFAEICEKSQVEPAKVFGVLTGDDPTNQGWEWEDDGDGGSGQSFRLYWLDVSGLTEEGSRLNTISALGFKLDWLASWLHGREPRVSAVTWREMEIYDRAARDVAKIFGVEGEPKLFSQVYCGPMRTWSEIPPEPIALVSEPDR